MGNTVVVLVVSVARIIGRRGVQRVADSGMLSGIGRRLRSVLHIIKAACFSCRNLAVLWPAFTVLLCPTIAVSVALIAQGRSGGVVLGVVGVLLWVVPWIVANRGVLCTKQPLPTSIARGERQRHRVLWKRAARALLEPSERVVLPKRTGKTLMRSFGAVFAAYRVCRMWYFNVELLFAVCTGTLMGVALASDPCTILTLGWVLAGLCAVECVVAIVVRPFATLIDLVTLLLVGALSIISEVVALTVDGEGGETAAASVGFAAGLIQLASAIMLVIEVVMKGTFFPAFQLAPELVRKLQMNSGSIISSKLSRGVLRPTRSVSPTRGVVVPLQEARLQKRRRVVSPEAALEKLIRAVCAQRRLRGKGVREKGRSKSV